MTAVVHPGQGRDTTPLFIVASVGGALNNLVDLGRAVGRHRKVVGFRSRSLLGYRPRETIEAVASDNIRYLRQHQPTGPYLLAGYSAGGQTAFEMARQLTRAGETVAQVVLIDALAPGYLRREAAMDAAAGGSGASLRERIASELGHLRTGGLDVLRQRLVGRLGGLVLRGRVLDLLALAAPNFVRSQRAKLAWFAAAKTYEGGAYAGPASLILSQPLGPKDEAFRTTYPYLGWDDLIASANITCMTLDAGHLEMVRGRHAEDLARFIEEGVAAAGGLR